MENVQRAKERVMVSEGYLHVKRLPKNTAQEIIEFFSNSDEFNGDWGMAMKFVWDTFKGTLPPKDEGIHHAILSLDDRVANLEKKIEDIDTEKKSTKMANGVRR